MTIPSTRFSAETNPSQAHRRAIQEIAFHVSDIHTTIAALTAKSDVTFVRGRRVDLEEHIPRTVVLEGKESKYVFVEDPNGIRVELLDGDR